MYKVLVSDYHKGKLDFDKEMPHEIEFVFDDDHADEVINMVETMSIRHHKCVCVFYAPTNITNA